MPNSDTLDPRLSDFDLDARRAAPVGKLIDPHVHYRGRIDDLETLANVFERYHVECMFLICGRDAGPQWLREVDRYFTIGQQVIPFYRIDMKQSDPQGVRAAYDMGFWGIKCIGPSCAYDDHFYDPVYAEAQQLGMPMLFHTGLLAKSGADPETGTGMSLMRADSLDTIAARFPELLIQGAHLGNPEIASAILSSVYSDNVIWDASGGCRHLLRVDPKILAAPLCGRAQLWDRIMFATDTASGVFSPEHADGWPTVYEYQLAFWQDILSRMPEPPNSEQLDGFFYVNAHRWLDRIKQQRQV